MDYDWHQQTLKGGSDAAMKIDGDSMLIILFYLTIAGSVCGPCDCGIVNVRDVRITKDKAYPCLSIFINWALFSIIKSRWDSINYS